MSIRCSFLTHRNMKSTYCTAISKSDDISPEKTFLLQSISPSLLGETTQEKTPFLLGKSKGQADQIDFDTFLKTEKVAKLEWRKPPNFTFTAELVTPVTPAAAVQLANWGPELGPASVLTFTWKLVLCGHFLTACQVAGMAGRLLN